MLDEAVQAGESVLRAENADTVYLAASVISHAIIPFKF